MLVAFKMNIFAVIGGTIVFSFSMCVLNQRALHREIGYKQEKMKTFVIPLMASIIMGVVALISQDWKTYFHEKSRLFLLCLWQSSYMELHFFYLEV